MENVVKAARQAREKAYVPYSGFKVGAAVLGKSGKIYTGCNIENASYGLTNCAERTAIFKAISEGEQQLSVLAVIADTVHAVAPCGACRQVMAEFRIPKIIMCNIAGDQVVTTLEELLPHSFTKNDVIGDGL